jgi:hypothetical protein
VPASEAQAQIETAVEPEPLSEKVDYLVEKPVNSISGNTCRYH